MNASGEEFTNQADPGLLERIREAARQDGRDYLKGRKQLGRPTVMAHYRSILAEHRPLAELLAQ